MSVWYFVSMCLDLSFKVFSFADCLHALLFSIILIGSLSNDESIWNVPNGKVFWIAYEKAMYSAYWEVWKTIGCLLLFHEIFPPAFRKNFCGWLSVRAFLHTSWIKIINDPLVFFLKKSVYRNWWFLLVNIKRPFQQPSVSLKALVNTWPASL